ncbi:MAG: hypothetical protein R2784_15840 [Saprospiraceae bacterium]
MTGSNTSDKRAAIVDYFKEEATIMVATEAVCRRYQSAILFPGHKL